VSTPLYLSLAFALSAAPAAADETAVKTTVLKVLSQTPTTGVLGYVLVADGAGNISSVSKMLGQALAREQAPLFSAAFNWCHEHHRFISDQMNFPYLRQKPEAPISLLGYSAGCLVILFAAESLPPNMLQRIILLSPSANSSYDLRRALRSTRRGIDVFYSPHDYVSLSLSRPLSFLTRGKQGMAAAYEGFLPCACDSDETYFSKLRQYRWSPEWISLGHGGGHFDYARLEFMEKMVFPLLLERD
jgi:hypothetical protein